MNLRPSPSPSRIFLFLAVCAIFPSLAFGAMNDARENFSEMSPDRLPDGLASADESASAIMDIVPAEASFLEIGQQIDRLESRVHRRQDVAEETKDEVERLQKKRSEAVQLKSRLEEPGGEEAVRIESQYAVSLAELKNSLRNARSAILPKEEAYQWDVKLRLDEMKDKIDHLKRAIPSEEAVDFKRNLSWLEAKRTQTRQKLVRLSDVKGQDWLEMRSDVEEMLNDLEYSYNDLKTQAGFVEPTLPEPDSASVSNS